MTELERALVALAGELDFPTEPDLVPRIGARLERRRLLVPRRRVLVLAVALVVVAFGIAMAVPDARGAILRFFHIGAVTVERVETLPAAKERPLTAGLGAPLSRREAERRSGFPIKLPDFEGSAPTRYYVRPGLIATLFRSESKPVLLVEFQGDQLGLTKKLTAPDTRVEPAPLGQFGLWLVGGRHVIRWEFGGGGGLHELETRLAGNVLIWLEGERTYRLEGDLSKAEMLKLGRQITR
jgi:hypothetical protein